MITIGVLALLVLLLVLIGLARSVQRERPPFFAPAVPAWLGRFLPTDPARAFAAAVVAAAILGDALVLLGIYGSSRSRYGWTLFVITPFVVGFVAAWLTSFRQAPSVRRFVTAGARAAVTAGLGFFAMGAEGLVCLLMSIPIAVPCAAVGALVAFLVHSRRLATPTVLGMIVCVVPLGFAAEPALLGAPPAHTVRSAVDIDAPPSAVWAHLVEFEPISAPLDSWLFRAGVAYPISATLRGHGAGAVRVCDFSTGRFV
jgi:hypothetical protein